MPHPQPTLPPKEPYTWPSRTQKGCTLSPADAYTWQWLALPPEDSGHMCLTRNCLHHPPASHRRNLVPCALLSAPEFSTALGNRADNLQTYLTEEENNEKSRKLLATTLFHKQIHQANGELRRNGETPSYIQIAETEPTRWKILNNPVRDNEIEALIKKLPKENPRT